MRPLGTVLAMTLALSMLVAGCGLLETNDDEMETLRAELIQLREDILDLQTEISLLAAAPPTTRAESSTTTRAPSATTSATPATTTTTYSAPATTTAAPPILTQEAEEEVLTATYEWGPSDAAVALQQVLGVTADGWYGNGTRASHVAALEDLDLPTDGVPSSPTAADDTTTTEAPAGDDTTTTEAPAADDTTTTEAPAETTTTVATTTTAA